jgi:hypothetical protein
MLGEGGVRYLAYMLRLWQVEGEDGAVWRASLEDAHTGERRGFASLEELVAWLREETGCTVHGAAQTAGAEEVRNVRCKDGVTTGPTTSVSGYMIPPKGWSE